jgi:mannose-1-phosphate guanylyltransferase
MKIIIRAGGIGTRLWPMSRAVLPKQFQKISGDKTMIRTTYDRVLPAVRSKKSIYVSVNSGFLALAKQELPELEEANLIPEPATRNTGPAVCLEISWLESVCDRNEVIASLPSDDFISDSDAFVDLLKASEKFIKKNPDQLLTPAIKPDYPDNGYSYFKAGDLLFESGGEHIYSVADVVEKPNSDYCLELVESGVYYAHTGMYLWQLGHVIGLFDEFQPEMIKLCREVVKLTRSGEDKKAAELYEALDKVSIESAITEKAPKIAMSVSNRIGWSDLGKWHVIKRILSQEGENLIRGEVVVNEARNNLIYSNQPKKIIAVNDIEDLVIVDTEDALFVSSMKNSAEVKKIVKRLKEENKNEYL